MGDPKQVLIVPPNTVGPVVQRLDKPMDSKTTSHAEFLVDKGQNLNSASNADFGLSSSFQKQSGNTPMEGAPSSVIIVAGEKGTDVTELDINNGPASAIHSRARPRRNDEPAPFLCIDNLPVDKVIIDGRSSAHAVPRKTVVSTVHRDVEVVPPSAAKRTPAATQAPGPSRVTSRSTVRNTPSAAFYNYNSFFTHKNPAFLSGPPSLWSMNNRFWPHATPPSDKSNLPHLPSALNLEIASERPRNTQPFKHGSGSKQIQERPVSPSFDMKIQTVNAIQCVSRKVSRQSVPNSSKEPSGRLLKGRLKPLQTFKVNGPSIRKCQGIQPGGATGRTFAPSQSRLLQRKRELLNMLPPDVFQRWPQTQESIHRTSIASTWNDTGDSEVENELPKVPSDDQNFEDPPDESKPCYQPPNSPSEVGDLRVGEGSIEDEDIYPEDNLTEGGASQILCKMIRKVQTSPSKGESGTDKASADDAAEDGITDRIIGEMLTRTKSEPDFSCIKMNLVNAVAEDELQVSDEHLHEEHEVICTPVSEMFDVTLAGILESTHNDNLDADKLDIEQATESPVQDSGTNPDVHSIDFSKDGRLATDPGSFKTGGQQTFDANGNFVKQENDRKFNKFFISEPSDTAIGSSHEARTTEKCGTDSLSNPSTNGSQEWSSSENTCVGHLHGDRPNSSNHGDSIKNHPYDSMSDDHVVDASHEVKDIYQMENHLNEGGENNDSDICSTNQDDIVPRRSCKDEVDMVHYHGDKEDDDDRQGGGSPRRGGSQSVVPCNHGSSGNHDNISNHGNTNTNNTGQGHQASESDDLEDIPDVDESVLFCAYCDLDIDDCRCYFTRDPALMAYQSILSEEEGRLKESRNDVIQGSEVSNLRQRPHSAPCSLMDAVTVIKGTKLLGKNNAHECQDRQRKEEQTSEPPLNKRLSSEDLSVVATPLKMRPTKSAESVPLSLSFNITGRPPEGMVYYFSYGADMNTDRLLAYLGGEEIEQRLWGVLFGFQLKFNRRGMELSAGGFPNISYSPDSSVEGCVYCLTLEELEKLDCVVGCPEFLIKVALPVWMVNCSDPSDPGVAQCCVPAVMYICKDDWIHNEPICNSYNLQQCLMGGDLLTPAYRDHLLSLMCDCCR